MAGKGKNKARAAPANGRRVVVVTDGGGAPKRLTNTPTTLNERFTQLSRKTQGRDAQVQRGTTARYAATMAKRTGLSAKQFQAVPVAVAGKGKRAQPKKQGVAVGKKLKTVTAVRVTAKATKATKVKKTDATAARGNDAEAKKASAKAKAPATRLPPRKQEAHAKKPKAKKLKPPKPELPKPEDLDKDLDSYMAAAPDPTLVA